MPTQNTAIKMPQNKCKIEILPVPERICTFY